jgi:uncharacterized membrane protein YphA (DoxX/SURF4 family)
LRVALAATLAIGGANRATRTFDGSAASAETIAYGLTMLVLSVPVALGFLTPIVQVGVVLVEAAAVASGFVLLADGRWPVPLLKVASGLALALIGPGAYSVDSRLFGRREIVIKPRMRKEGGGSRRK